MCGVQKYLSSAAVRGSSVLGGLGQLGQTELSRSLCLDWRLEITTSHHVLCVSHIPLSPRNQPSVLITQREGDIPCLSTTNSQRNAEHVTDYQSPNCLQQTLAHSPSSYYPKIFPVQSVIYQLGLGERRVETGSILQGVLQAAAVLQRHHSHTCRLSVGGTNLNILNI